MRRHFALRFVSTLFTAALLLLFCPVYAQDHALPSDPPTSKDVLIAPAQRRPATGFTLTDSDGQTFSLAKTHGKVVVLNFWATWCGGCKFELPYFVTYDRTYRPQGLVTLGISMDDEGFKVVKPFWATRSMPYPTVIGSQALGKQLGLSGMPYTLLLDRHGRIAIAHAGVLDRADFDLHIQQLLASNN